MPQHETEHETSSKTHSAGAFDVRNFIGALIGIYGVVLVITSFFDGADELAKSDGVRINLWAGLGMIAVSVFFLAWARLRPVIVPEETPSSSSQTRPPEAGGVTDSPPQEH